MKKGFLLRVFTLLLLAVVAATMILSSGCKKKQPTSSIEKLKQGVTKEDINNRVKEMESSIKSANKNTKIPASIKKNLKQQAKMALERERNLLLLADKQGIKIDDKQVNKRLAQIKDIYKTQKGGFKGILKKTNKTESQFKEMILKQMINEELRKKLSKDIKVTDKDIKDFYNKQKDVYFTDQKTKKVRSFEEVKGLIKQIIVSEKVNDEITKQSSAIK